MRSKCGKTSGCYCKTLAPTFYRKYGIKAFKVHWVLWVVPMFWISTLWEPNGLGWSIPESKHQNILSLSSSWLGGARPRCPAFCLSDMELTFTDSNQLLFGMNSSLTHWRPEPVLADPQVQLCQPLLPNSWPRWAAHPTRSRAVWLLLSLSHEWLFKPFSPATKINECWWLEAASSFLVLSVMYLWFIFMIS